MVQTFTATNPDIMANGGGGLADDLTSPDLATLIATAMALGELYRTRLDHYSLTENK